MVENIIFALIDVAIVNSFIIYKSISGEVNHKMFQVNLAKSLVMISEMRVSPSPRRGHPQSNDVRAEHCSVAIENERLDQNSTKASKGRNNCRLCYELDKKQLKTPWQCSKCKIPLCVQLDRNCFQKWHTAACENLRT